MINQWCAAARENKILLKIMPFSKIKIIKRLITKIYFSGHSWDSYFKNTYVCAYICMCYTKKTGMCLSVSRTGTQKDSRSLFGKRVAYCLFSLKAFFFGGQGEGISIWWGGKNKAWTANKTEAKNNREDWLTPCYQLSVNSKKLLGICTLFL